jgi:hypothetical protein
LKPSRFTGTILLAVLALLVSSACAFTNAITQRFTGRATETPPIRYFPEEEALVPPPLVVPEIQAPTQEILPFYQPGERVEFPAAALSALHSYRSILNLRSVGQTGDETEVVQELEILKEHIRMDDATHQRIRGDGIGGSQQGALAFYRFADQAFAYVPQDETDRDAICMQYDSSDQDHTFAGALVPHEIFNSFEILDLIALNDDVNGVLAQRYSVQSVDLSLGSSSQVMGEIWIAQDAGYVVRFQGESSGTFMMSEQMSEGVLTWDYQVTLIDALEEITLPAACLEQKSTGDFPTPENTFNRTIFSGLISFESLDTPLSIARFYRVTLPKEGWEITSDEVFGDFFMLEAQRDDRQVQITISPGEDGALVVIVDGRATMDD